MFPKFLRHIDFLLFLVCIQNFLGFAFLFFYGCNYGCVNMILKLVVLGHLRQFSHNLVSFVLLKERNSKAVYPALNSIEPEKGIYSVFV